MLFQLRLSENVPFNFGNDNMAGFTMHVDVKFKSLNNCDLKVVGSFLWVYLKHKRIKIVVHYLEYSKM